LQEKLWAGTPASYETAVASPAIVAGPLQGDTPPGGVSKANGLDVRALQVSCGVPEELHADIILDGGFFVINKDTINYNS